MPLQPSGFVTNTAGDIYAIQNADSSITRLAKTQSNATPIRVVSVAATMGATTVSNTGGLVTLTGAGVHGLTTGNVVTPTTLCNVYITWTGTGKAGVDGLYVVNAVTSTTVFTIRLTFVSSTVTFTIANAAYSASTLYRLGDLVTYSGSLYVCNVASSFGRTAPDFGEDFVLADSSRNGGIVNWTGHGRTANDPITLSGGTPPAAMPAGLYYVKRVIDANRFTLSSTVGGAEIVITDVGTPTTTATLFYGTPTVTPVATAITMLSLPVAANTLTERGSLKFDALMSVATSVNGKTPTLGFGTAANLYLPAALTTQVGQVLSKQGWRCGGNKFITSAALTNGTVGTTALQSLTIDATVDQQFIVQGTMAVANEVMTLEAYRLEVD